MRKFVTAAAAALVLVASVASPASADQNYPYPGNSGYGQNQGQYQGQYDDDYRYPQERRDPRYDNYNFDRHNGNFDRWERGWTGQNGYDQQQYRYHKPLSQKKLVRALAYQGYYGVRNLQRSRWGSDYRAFAFTRNGRPVMLRVNAFTGRVSDVRYV
ncbi:MAG: hypothetical protein HOP13_08645 [Alphaproteobacteria bacterium]|nr:hypothetical protein [Alphaproteobacteria bacterium]